MGFEGVADDGVLGVRGVRGTMEALLFPSFEGVG